MSPPEFVREGLVLIIKKRQELVRPQGQQQLEVAVETAIEELVQVAGSTGADQAQAMDETEDLEKLVRAAQKLVYKCVAQAHARFLDVRRTMAKFRLGSEKGVLAEVFDRVHQHCVSPNAAGSAAGAERFWHGLHTG